MRRFSTELRASVGFLLLVFVACSSSRSQESVSSTSQAVTSPSTARVLSFEQPTTDWSVSNLNLQQGNQVFDGAHSAAVTVVASGGTLTSVPLSSFGPVSSTATVQIQLPSYLKNQSWQGQLELKLNCPSAGVWGQVVGPFAFQGVPTGVFRQAQFTLPPSVVSALSTTSFSDLVVSLLVEFNPNPNTTAGFVDPFYIDRLDLGQGALSGGGAGGSGGAAGSSGSSGAAGAAGHSGNGPGGVSGTAGAAGSAGVAGVAGNGGGGGASGSSNGSSAGSSSAGASGAGASSGPCDGGTSTSNDPSVSNPNCVDGACCTTSANIITLTPNSDTYSNTAASACIVGLASSDTLFSAAAGVTVVGGVGDDTISAGQFSPPGTGVPPVRIFGGPGNDTISGWFNDAQIYGGPGDDTISAGPGPALIAPGSGVDNVSSGDGDDTFILYSECEATPGKKLQANGGVDTLISPLSIDELRARGLTVEGIENVIIRSDACKSDCTSKPSCGPGTQCIDQGGQAVCGGGVGSSCQTCSDCVVGLSCTGGTCQDPCLANPKAAGCSGAPPPHCSNGVLDGDETGVDCGGSGCASCPSGTGCASDTDCAQGLVCGTSNGACFGSTRAQRICWSPACEGNVNDGGCGTPNSPCGQNCACVNTCNATSPTSTCPGNEVCKAGLGPLFKTPGSDVCLDARCPSSDPALCGAPDSVCGTQCLCTPSCTLATCQNPGDGCGGVCSGVCKNGDTGCTDDVACGPGLSCIADSNGVNTCRPRACAFRVLAPPFCGTSGAMCGDQCPACTPRCDGRQCGLDPNCGQSCGSCGDGTACNASGQCETPTKDAPLTVPDGNGGQKPLLPLPPVTDTSVVGSLAARFSVSDQGSAQYSVPIEVPPGRAGMEPALTLTYSGSHLNADVGVGWHLDGLSRITRCARSYALDGASGAVKDNLTDHFCIDGKRLESVAGVYGADGTEYRTLIDSFAKVISHSDSGLGIQLDPFKGVAVFPRAVQGPDSFQVFTKDGRILTYGSTQDSLILGRNGVRYGWLLNRVEDRAGNTMTVIYTNLAYAVPTALQRGVQSVVRPSVIAYTGHASNPVVTGNREVHFTYESRTDPQLTFLQGGVPFSTVARLSRITTFVNHAAVKNYHLQYAASDLSQVETISECTGVDDTRCKPPTTFTYTVEEGFTLGTSGVSLQSAGRFDANGDGIPDFLTTHLTVNGVPSDATLGAVELGTDIAVGIAGSALLGPIGGEMASLTWDVVKGPFWGLFGKSPTINIDRSVLIGTASRDNSAFKPAIMNVTGIHCDGLHPFFLADYNQDGRDDVISACDRNDGTFYVALSQGDGTFKAFPSIDQPIMMAGIGPAALGPRRGFPGPAEPAAVVLDVDGDGLQDIVYCEDQYTLDLRRRLAPPQGFDPNAIRLRTPVPPAPQKGQPPPPARAKLPLCDNPAPAFTSIDVDGDGTLDLLARGADGWVVLRYSIGSDGTGQLSWEPTLFPDVGTSQSGALSMGDFNGDGLMDVWSTKDDAQKIIWLNTGGGQFVSRSLDRPRPALALSPQFRYQRGFALDYEATGRDDLLEHWEYSDPPVDGEIFTHRFNPVLAPDSQVSFLSGFEAKDIYWMDVDKQFVPGDFFLTGDVDGDGNTDLLGNENSVFYGSGSKNTLLSRVVDGLGNFVSVDYNPGAYQPDEKCILSAPADSAQIQYPEKCLPRMPNLVSGHHEGFTTNTGDIVERDYSYKYIDARVNVAGHGFLGFDRRTIDEHAEVASGDPGRTTTIDYVPIARYDLNGNPTQSSTPPYLYPLAGLVQATTVDQHVGANSVSPIQMGLFERRTQTINTWAVRLSAFNRPFPFVSDRSTTTYDRPVAVIGPPPESGDNGTTLFTCMGNSSVNGYGNITSDIEGCQSFATGAHSFISVEDTVTVRHYSEDPIAWLISNPDNIKVTSTHVTPSDSVISTSTEEWGLTYVNGLLGSVTRAPTNGTPDTQRVTTYARDNFGNVQQITEQVANEPTRTTTVTFDADSVFPRTVTNAKSQTSQVSFDARWGAPVATVDPNGIAQQTLYDDFGRLVQTTGPEGTSISTYSPTAFAFAQTAVGQIEPRVQVSTETQGTAGTRTGSTVVEYDNYGRLVLSQSQGFGGANVISEQAYDSLGRVEGRTLPHTGDVGQAPFLKYTYDDLQRVTRVDHSDNTFKEYQYASKVSLAPALHQWVDGVRCLLNDEAGFVPCYVDITLSIDEEHKRDVAVTDHRGLVLRSIDGDNVDGVQHSSNYWYGAFNRLIQTHDNRDFVTGFDYDDYGRLRAQTSPDSGRRAYTYNGFDELNTSSDQKAQLRTYHHDLLGRTDSIIDPVGTTQWTYDQGVNALGRLSESISPATAENPSGQSISYAYEPGSRGALQQATYTIDGTAYPVSLEYDDLARTSRIHYPNTGSGQPIVAQYNYDSSGTLSGLDEVGSGTAKQLWRLQEAFQGQFIQRETFGNNASTIYGYDPNRRWLQNVQTTLGAESIQSLEYTHYNNGLVHGLDAGNASPHSYQYDNVNRLSFVVANPVQGAPLAVPYTYDDLGNLVGHGSTISTYLPQQPHLLSSVGSDAYQYDANGNVSSRNGPDIPGGSQTLEYTPFDLPQSIRTGGISPLDNIKTTRFEYSADQERLVRRDPETTRHFVTDLYQHLLDNSGNTLEERFRLFVGGRQLGEIVRKDGSDKTLYFHTDHLGSTDTISDSNGASFSQHFDPFGLPLDPPNPEITRVGFTGQDQDTDLGLTDMRGRIYDPLAGRFTTADPVMQAPFWSQGLNPYSYVFNDPINNIDPSGFDSSGADSTFGITGWGASVVGIAALQGFNVGAGAILGGIGGAGTNVVTSLLGGPGYGAGSPGSTTAITPSAAPRGSGGNRAAPLAGAQNQTAPGSSRSPVQTGSRKPLNFPKIDRPGGADDLRLAANCADGPEVCLATSWADEMEALAEDAQALKQALKAAAIVVVESAEEVTSETLVKLAPMSLIFQGPDVNPAGIVHAQGYTDKVGKVAQEAEKTLGRRVTPKEVNEAIHRVKENLGRGGPIKNPDVMIDPTSGDVRPKIPGGMGDSIGNIYDYL